jgi:hypothetical protein
MKFLTIIFFSAIIFSCTPKEVNTIKFKFRTEEVVNRDCKIAKEQKKLSRRNDVTSKNFMTHYTKAFNANRKVKRACDPYR